MYRICPPQLLDLSQEPTTATCVNLILEEIHVLATRLASYASSDSITAQITS
jgi:hypothetical protein